MKSRLLIGFWLILFIAAAEMGFGLTVAAPGSVVLGDAIAVQVPYSPQISRMSVRLIDSGGRVMGASRAFPYPRGSSARSWVALVAIPTTLYPGTYTLETRLLRDNKEIRHRSPLKVLSRSFHRENIDLNGTLSELQKEQTPEKKAQAQALWRLLTTFNPDAVFQATPFIVPVKNYVVTAPFAERRDYVFAQGGRQASIHQGIDLAVAAGTPVEAAAAGQVVFAGPLIMTGNTVVIEHLPEVYSLYFHMERLLVTKGQRVAQGQAVGLVGSTGLATGPHLHWQVEVDGVAVNPMSLVQNGLIRSSVPASLNRQTAAEQ